MHAFADWFEWPMLVDGKRYTTDIPMRALLAEIWLFKADMNFYEAWRIGVNCGRIVEIPGVRHEQAGKGRQRCRERLEHALNRQQWPK